VELVRWVLLVGQAVDDVFERQQHTGVHLQCQVEIERAAAAVLGVQLDLPCLAQAVGLDEVPLVVHVEPVVDCVVLDLGDEARDVDDGHPNGTWY